MSHEIGEPHQVVVRLHADVSGFKSAMAAYCASPLTRAIDAWVARLRHNTRHHARGTPRRSRMHAAYRAKTRHRNRRGNRR